MQIEESYTVISTLPTPLDVGHNVQFEGTVLRSSNTKLLEHTRTYRCTKCKTEYVIEAKVENSFQFELPKRCNGTTKTGDSCKNKKFKQYGE